MSHIKIGHKLINTPVEVILQTARKELTNGKLKRIDDKGRNLLISCPIHKGGMENHPSCNVLNIADDPNLEAGTAHCFACGYRANMVRLIGDLFEKTDEWAQEWLCDRFFDTYIIEEEYLPPIDLHRVPGEKQTISEESLKEFDFYHPYMWHRKLSKEVVDQFRVGYDKSRGAITFPVYDEKHNLVMVTARSVNSKRFYIPEKTEKPVYLLYDILDRGITKVYVCESQINTLYLRSLGYDAIGLFGTGSYTQLDTLKRSGIRSYILCFDGDEAGRKGANRFKKHIGNDVFITDVLLPRGKDVNDLSAEELENLFQNS